jgi:hypothetical protein
MFLIGHFIHSTVRATHFEIHPIHITKIISINEFAYFNALEICASTALAGLLASITVTLFALA